MTSSRVLAQVPLLGLATVLASSCVDPDPRFESPAAVFESLSGDLHFTPMSELDPEAGTAVAPLALSIEASDESIVGLIGPEPAGQIGCDTVMAMAFRPIAGEVDDLASLAEAAAAWTGKDVAEFEAVPGVDGRLLPSRDPQGCAESVLAVTFDDVYLFAVGDPEAIDLLVRDLRDG